MINWYDLETLRQPLGESVPLLQWFDEFVQQDGPAGQIEGLVDRLEQSGIGKRCCNPFRATPHRTDEQQRRARPRARRPARRQKHLLQRERNSSGLRVHGKSASWVSCDQPPALRVGAHKLWQRCRVLGCKDGREWCRSIWLQRVFG